MLRKMLLGAGLACAIAGVAWGQNVPVVPKVSTHGTVTTHLVFQQALAANTNRNGCLIVNRSTDVLLVYFQDQTGTAPNSSDSVPLAAAAATGGAGGAVNCNGFGLSIQGAVWVSSLTADGAAYTVITQ